MAYGKSVVEKHTEDVWLLTCAIKRCENVPHILLRNGKRGKVEFVRSQTRQIAKKAGDGSCTDCYEIECHGVNESLSLNLEGEIRMDVAVAGELAAVVSEQCAFDSIAGGDARDCVDKSVFESAVVESINSLRQQVGELRSVVRNLKTTGAALSQNTN